MSKVSGKFFRKVVQHDFYDTAEQVSAVVLLNSPANGSWECEEYLRLLRMRRFTPQLNGNYEATHACRCYFICTDGAYSFLYKYVRQQQEQKKHLQLFLYLPLCDAVIGDMDSYETRLYNNDCNNVELPLLAPSDGYATVDDIPSAVLDKIYDKIFLSVTEFCRLSNISANQLEKNGKYIFNSHKDNSDLLPLWLHVRCQDTTDFAKALRFINRLRERRPSDATVFSPPLLHTPKGLQLLQTGGEVNLGANGCGLYLDSERERQLCEAASAAEVLLLPTYVVLGALGGRIDHEMAAISTILSCCNEAHVVLTNETNTLFTCQPNGWTQIVRQPGYETLVCGLINFGVMKECETSGLRWNVVTGREKITGPQNTMFMIGMCISTSNIVRREVVTVDLCCQRFFNDSQSLLTKEQRAYENNSFEEYPNPLVVFTIERNGKSGKSDALVC